MGREFTNPANVGRRHIAEELDAMETGVRT